MAPRRDVRGCVRIALVLSCAAVAGAPAMAAPAYAPMAAAGAKPLPPAQRMERRFLQVTAANMRFQADGSRLVATRSNNPAVKDLAGAVLSRQQAAQPELLRLLHARGMALPMTTGEHGKVLRQLAKLQGAKFDRLYVDEVVVRSYRLDIGNFEKAAAQAQDPVLKAWAGRQLPVLRMQLDNAGKALPGAQLRGQRAV